MCISLTWELVHPILLLDGELLKVDLYLADCCTFTIRLHVLHLNVQVFDSLNDIERANLVPHRVVRAWDFERIAAVTFDA
jgi:hypothetical protein